MESGVRVLELVRNLERYDARIYFVEDYYWSREYLNSTWGEQCLKTDVNCSKL